ncbi:hypothetical protein IAQ61_009346 [Plenodomus lingam]|uniref:uncharacterized protein n=1 Tax=Leptosphaeria maculans TaxID=5022 RepID=UPI00331674DE|nr:hypothetical protein IAQ61_009346 [Plenodomus lingam]
MPSSEQLEDGCSAASHGHALWRPTKAGAPPSPPQLQDKRQESPGQRPEGWLMSTRTRGKM